MEQAARKEREVEQARDFIKTGKVGRVAAITIDHPPTNSISTGILQDLAELVSDYAADDSIRAILLDTANGKPPFAADATDLLANPSWEKQFQLIQAGGRVLTAIEFSSKPVVMAIYDGIWEAPWSSRWPAIFALPAKAPYSRVRKLSRARRPDGVTVNGLSIISGAARPSSSH